MSYSQIQQDRWVIDALKGQRGGYFVELGANDGLHHSNTLLLEEKYGWHGSLVEADRDLIPALRANRPNCHIINAAISDRIGRATFFKAEGRGSSYNGLAEHMPQEWVDKHMEKGSKTAIVDTVPLSWALPFHLEYIDYLSLDVEGAELLILDQLLRDMPKLHIATMTVEFRYCKELLNALQLCLRGRMKLDRVIEFDACFVSE